MNHRVKVTEIDIGKLEESSSKDDNLVDDAKRKVGIRIEFKLKNCFERKEIFVVILGGSS